MKKKVVIGIILLIVVALGMLLTSNGFKKGFKDGRESTQGK